MKKPLIAAALVLGAPCAALADSAWIDRFASCAGRLSAQMEHQWLLADARSARTQSWRTDMVDVLDAVVTDGNATRVMALRIDAKVAQAALLSRATFNTDDSDAVWAARRADREVAACVALLLNEPESG